MLDLFRKEEINALNSKIKSLEEENRKLSLLLTKKEDKTRKTVATKQEVDRELNEAKHLIQTLENEAQKLREETRGELNFRFSDNFSRNRLEDLLFLLGSMQSRTATLTSIYLSKDETLDNIPSEIAAHIRSPDRVLIEKIDSHTGRVIFNDASGIIKLVMLPVFPILHTECSLERRFNLELLKKCLECDKTLVINAHAGETFIGIVENDSLVEHDIIRSSVMGKHSKGGWSQKRFQSLVEEDIKHHADKVKAALDQMIGKHRDIKYIIAGGETKLVRMMLEGHDYPVIMKSMDAVSLHSAEQVLHDAMAIRVYGL